MSEETKTPDLDYTLPVDKDGGRYFPILNPIVESTGSQKVYEREKSAKEMGLKQVEFSSLANGDLVYRKGQDGCYYLWKVVHEGGEVFFEFMAETGMPNGDYRPTKHAGDRRRYDPGEPSYHYYKLLKLPSELNAERLTPESIRVGMKIKRPELDIVDEVIAIDKERQRVKLQINYASGASTTMWRPFDDLGDLIAA